MAKDITIKGIPDHDWEDFTTEMPNYEDVFKFQVIAPAINAKRQRDAEAQVPVIVPANLDEVTVEVEEGDVESTPEPQP